MGSRVDNPLCLRFSHGADTMSILTVLYPLHTWSRTSHADSYLEISKSKTKIKCSV